MNANLAATVASLKSGDRVRATFSNGEYHARVEGPVVIDRGAMFVGGRDRLTYPDGTLRSFLTAVEVLAPALPPEPPVGSGVFHDGVLWQGSSNDYWTAYIDGQWIFRRWAGIQPCVPAVPQEPEVRAEPVGLSTDEPDVPVESLAVFRAKDGGLVTLWKWHDGSWSGRLWADAVRAYGAPVAVIPAGGDSC